jgi:hypothetical protein
VKRGDTHLDYFGEKIDGRKAIKKKDHSICFWDKHKLGKERPLPAPDSYIYML